MAHKKNSTVDMEKRVEILHEETGSDDSAWVLYKTPEGYLTLEMWDYPASYGDEGGDFEVYRVDVADDVLKELDWVDWKGYASYIGATEQELRDAAVSDNPIARAQVYESLRGYVSSQELDSDPLHLTHVEMHKRWPSIVDEPEIEIDDYEAFGPDKKNPTSGLSVKLWNKEVEITEWTDIYDATGEPEDETAGVLRVDATVDLETLFDPKGKHRQIYSGDGPVSYEDVLGMDPKDQQDAIVNAAISYLGYFGGTESHVDAVGD